MVYKIAFGPADPLGIEDMYYNHQLNPSKAPEWIAIRGSSKLEGYHPHLHACLPGTNYAPALADAIIALFNFAWNYKRSVQNTGALNHNFHDLWLLERMQQLCEEMEWQYQLPAWQPAPADNGEKFGLDYVAAVALARQETDRHKGTAHQLLSEPEEESFDSSATAFGPLGGDMKR